MNVALKMGSDPADVAVAHSVMGYDRATGELVSELAIPLFLDSLALKIAGVPADDVFGAVSYPLTARQVETFGFLLGLDADPQTRDYFLEATPGPASAFSPGVLEAVAILSAATPAPRPDRRRSKRVSEAELVVPILCLLETSDTGWVGATELIRRLSELLAPSGADAGPPAEDSTSRLSQTVRGMISHREGDASFIKQGLAQYDPAEHGLRISEHGRSLIQALRSRRDAEPKHD